MPRAHVAFLFSEHIAYPPDGIDLKSFHVSKELQRRLTRVTWVSLSENFDRRKVGGVDAIGIGSGRGGLLSFLLTSLRLQVFCLVNRVNCVYDFDWALLRGSPLRKIALQFMLRLIRVMYVLVQDDPLVDYEVACARLTEGSQTYHTLTQRYAIIYRLSDLIILPTRAYVDVLARRGVPARKLLGEFLGIDGDRFNPHLDGSAVRAQLGLDGKFVIGWFGNMNPYRRITEVIIPTIKSIGRDIPNAHFVIVGRGELKEEFVRLKESEYGERFTLLDFIPNINLPPYYAGCDVTISPLSLEYVFTRNALSIKVVESIAVATPVVATRTRATLYELKTLEGIIWTGDDFQSFYNALLEMHQNHSQFSQLARNQSREMDPYLTESTSAHIAESILALCA